MKNSQEPVLLDIGQKAQAVGMLARAFAEDPIYTAVFPDEAERKLGLHRLFGGVVGYCLVYGKVYTTASVEGVACWLPPGNTEITFGRMLRAGLELPWALIRLKSAPRRRFQAVLAYMDRVHKEQVSGLHWHLWALGVEPGHQKRGIGGRLMQPVFDEADREGVPCYLETESPGNVAYYEKWGFQVVSDGVVPGPEIRVWTMLRPPDRQGRSSFF